MAAWANLQMRRKTRSSSHALQRDAEGAPGAAQNDHKRRVERARAQSAAEGLLLPAEHGSRPVSAQGLRRRGRAIAQAERESAQGGGAAGEEGESSVVRRVRRRTTGQCAAAGEGEDEGVDEGVDAAGEQGEARRRGAPLAGTANSSPVETPSGSPATSCGRV